MPVNLPPLQRDALLSTLVTRYLSSLDQNPASEQTRFHLAQLRSHVGYPNPNLPAAPTKPEAE